MATEMDDSSDFIEPASDGAESVDSDEFAVTSDYDPTVNESLIGSVSSSVYAHCHEHGRRYHMYKHGRYPIPNDDKEYGREALRHALFLELLDGRLHLAPLGDSPQKILDVGTGFGDWAIEMGDRYPSATVVGLDLSPIQPLWVPPNVEFIIEDVEEADWIHGSDFDYVHFRMASVAMREAMRVISRAYENLKPGGWIEFQELYPRVGCNDDSMPPEYPLVHFYRLIAEVLHERYGWDLFIAERLPAALGRLGCINIQRKVIHVPVGFWPKDRRRMHHAFLFREILSEFLPALKAKPFSEAEVPMSPGSIDVLFRKVMDSVAQKRIHAYVPFHFVWAQKPPLTGG